MNVRHARGCAKYLKLRVPALDLMSYIHMNICVLRNGTRAEGTAKPKYEFIPKGD